jgi:hypothetical protein
VYPEIMVLYLNSGGVRLYIGVYFILGDSLNCPKSSSTNNDGPGKLACLSSKIVAKAGSNVPISG